MSGWTSGWGSSKAPLTFRMRAETRTSVFLAGVFVAAGHEDSGLTLGPATAQLVAYHLLGAAPKHILDALPSLQSLVPKCFECF